MQPLIAIASRTDNTARVAEAVGGVLGAELRNADDVNAEALQGRPLVGLGSGIYWLGHDRQVYALVDRIPESTPVFTITTSGFHLGLLVRLYKWRLRRRLEKRGLRVIAEVYSPGHDKFVLFRWMGLSKNRPDEKDLEQARELARTMGDTLARSTKGRLR